MSIFQTQFSHRERYEARRLGLAALPLDQHLAGGHGAREPRVHLRPHAGPPLRAMADKRPHGAPRLDEPPVLPRAARTQWEGGRRPLGGLAGGIAQDHPRLCHLPPPPRHGVRRDRGGGPRPRDHPAPWLAQQTPGAPDAPAGMGAALAAKRLGTATRAPGVPPLAPLRVEAPASGRGGHAGRRPVLRGREEAPATGARGEAGAQGARVTRQPARDRPGAPAFAGLEPPQGDDRTGPAVGLGGWGDRAQRLIALIEQRRAKIDRGHAALLSRAGGHIDQPGGGV